MAQVCHILASLTNPLSEGEHGLRHTGDSRASMRIRWPETHRRAQPLRTGARNAKNVRKSPIPGIFALKPAPIGGVLWVGASGIPKEARQVRQATTSLLGMRGVHPSHDDRRIHQDHGRVLRGSSSPEQYPSHRPAWVTICSARSQAGLGIALADDAAVSLDCGAVEHGHARAPGLVAATAGTGPPAHTERPTLAGDMTISLTPSRDTRPRWLRRRKQFRGGRLHLMLRPVPLVERLTSPCRQLVPPACPPVYGRACPSPGLPQPESALTTRPNHPLPRQDLHVQASQRPKAAHRNLLFARPPVLSAARVITPTMRSHPAVLELRCHISASGQHSGAATLFATVR